jgi:hypothetical protein
VHALNRELCEIALRLQAHVESSLICGPIDARELQTGMQQLDAGRPHAKVQ